MSIAVIVVGVILVFLLLRFLVKKISAILVFVLALISLLSILYFANIWPFDKTMNIEHLESTYCKDKADVKCKCIVEPLLEDLKTRHTKEELNKINGDKIKSALAIAKSFGRNKENIQNCLIRNEAEDQLKDFMIEVFHVDIDPEEIEDFIEKFDEL